MRSTIVITALSAILLQKTHLINGFYVGVETIQKDLSFGLREPTNPIRLMMMTQSRSRIPPSSSGRFLVDPSRKDASYDISSRSSTIAAKYNRSTLKMNKGNQENEWMKNLGEPIELESLKPSDAGPLFNTCGSNNGFQVESNKEVEVEEELNAISTKEGGASGNPDIDNLGTPLELESFLGLEPNSRNDEEADQMGAVPLFSGTLILLASTYFILGVFFEGVPLDMDVLVVPTSLLF